MNKNILGVVLALGIMNANSNVAVAMSINAMQLSAESVDQQKNEKLQKQLEALLAEAKKRNYTPEQTQAFLCQVMADAVANGDNEFRLQPESSNKLIWVVGGVVVVGLVGFGCYKLYQHKNKKIIDVRKINNLSKKLGTNIFEDSGVSESDAQKIVDALCNNIENDDVNALITTVGDLLDKSEIELARWALEHSGFDSVDTAGSFFNSASEAEVERYVQSKLDEFDITEERVKSVAGYLLAGMKGAEKVAIREKMSGKWDHRQPALADGLQIIDDVMGYANVHDKECSRGLKGLSAEEVARRIQEEGERIFQTLNSI